MIKHNPSQHLADRSLQSATWKKKNAEQPAEFKREFAVVENEVEHTFINAIAWPVFEQVRPMNQFLSGVSRRNIR
jgi:hypothetical protein